MGLFLTADGRFFTLSITSEVFRRSLSSIDALGCRLLVYLLVLLGVVGILWCEFEQGHSGVVLVDVFLCDKSFLNEVVFEFVSCPSA